jgi:hypothetical protein
VSDISSGESVAVRFVGTICLVATVWVLVLCGIIVWSLSLFGGNNLSSDHCMAAGSVRHTAWPLDFGLADNIIFRRTLYRQ